MNKILELLKELTILLPPRDKSWHLISIDQLDATRLSIYINNDSPILQQNHVNIDQDDMKKDPKILAEEIALFIQNKNIVN